MQDNIAEEENAGLENDGINLTDRKTTDKNIERTPWRIMYELLTEH